MEKPKESVTLQHNIMCGIFGLLNNKQTYNNKIIKTAFDRGDKRGPEDSQMATYSEKLIIGFKRLAINGLNETSSQPMTIGGVTLICNGEIYNYKKLYKMMNIKPTTGSDCEVIIRMYKKYGFEYTVSMLDGVFAIMIYDTSDLSSEPIIHIARDPFGVRPLYVLEVNHNGEYYKNNVDDNITTESIIAFASEVKMLSPLLGESGHLTWGNYRTSMSSGNRRLYDSQRPFVIKPVPPGTISSYSKSFLVNSDWRPTLTNKCYFKLSSPTTIIPSHTCSVERSAIEGIFYHLDAAVQKRVIGTTERPIACLLSGGLDSSVITALVNKYYSSGTRRLKTFSIGMPGSDDIKNARIVAEHLKTDHTEIVLTPDEFFNAIPEVIDAIQSYDTTTVRASVGNYLVGKYIADTTDAKVVFNGDGSDEVTGGYLYFLNAPNDLEFDKECRRLVTNIHTFDVLRSDRSISSNGLEPRTPFLDKNFVNYYMSLPIELRNPLTRKSDVTCEKHLLRQAICEMAPDLLPHDIVWRTKEAFSDGVSGDSSSWFQIIQAKVNNMDLKPSDKWKHNTPQTQEQIYYRGIYESLFPGTEKTIPYFWMPRFVEAGDCSARTLKIYSDRQHGNNLELQK